MIIATQSRIGPNHDENECASHWHIIIAENLLLHFGFQYVEQAVRPLMRS
jgi:hypothetical protein